jgi:hypothetical protein
MNITNITINNIQDLIILSHQETLGLLPFLILFGIFAVSITYLQKRFNTAVSIFVSLVLELPIVLVFGLLGLVSGGVILIYLLILGMSGVFAFMKKGD